MPNNNALQSSLLYIDYLRNLHLFRKKCLLFSKIFTSIYYFYCYFSYAFIVDKDDDSS